MHTYISSFSLLPSLPSIVTEEASTSHSARHWRVQGDLDAIPVLSKSPLMLLK